MEIETIQAKGVKPHPLVKLPPKKDYLDDAILKELV